MVSVKTNKIVCDTSHTLQCIICLNLCKVLTVLYLFKWYTIYILMECFLNSIDIHKLWIFLTFGSKGQIIETRYQQ